MRDVSITIRCVLTVGRAAVESAVARSSVAGFFPHPEVETESTRAKAKVGMTRPERADREWIICISRDGFEGFITYKITENRAISPNLFRQSLHF